MSINSDDSFDVNENGVAIRDNDGNALAYFTTVGSDPTGSAAPQNTWVFRSDTQTMFYKFGAGNNDWRQIRAEDMTFDPSSSDEVTDTDLQAAVQTIANRNFGKNYVFSSNDSFSTTSTTLVDVVSVSGTFPAGTYHIEYAYTVTNSKSNTDNTSNVNFGGTQIFTRDQSGLLRNSVSAFQGDLVHAGGSLTCNIEIQRTTGNGNALMDDAKLHVWRVA